MLIYSMIASLDGYTADAEGKFDWAAPDEEVHAFVNDLERGTGTYLYGRRMYEALVVWETMSQDGQPPVMRDYAGGRQVLRAPSMASTRRPNGTASTGCRDRSGRARRARRVVRASALSWAWLCRSATLALASS